MRARLYLLFYGRERKCAERAWRRTRININTSERAERNISDSFMSATADDLDGTKGIEVSVIEEENNVTSNTPTVESINLTINCKKTTKYCSQVYPILGKVTHFEMLLGVTFCLVAAGMLTGGVTGGVLYFIDKNRPMMPPPTMPPLPPHVPSPWLPPSSPEPPSPPPPPATCSGPLADLAVDATALRASAKLDDVWDGDPCLVQERCVTGEGAREVLRFDTVIANVGCADFFVGEVNLTSNVSDVSKQGIGWTWHTCHQHWHYDNYAHYSLRSFCELGPLSSGTVAVAWEDRPVVGHKNGWCVEDSGTYGYDPHNVAYNGSNLIHARNVAFNNGLPFTGSYDERDRWAMTYLDGVPPAKCGAKFNCIGMGITSGCYDAYDAQLACQWIDVTDTPDGDYWLTVNVNWNSEQRKHVAQENDYSNNEASIPVRIGGPTFYGNYRNRRTLTVLSDVEVAALQRESCVPPAA